ncbi:MAG: branched-chain amino acid ABC transporter permease [Chloroflexia bacterium]
MQEQVQLLDRIRETWSRAQQELGPTRRGLRHGLVLGGVALFLALAGLLEIFSKREVLGNVLSMSTALLMLLAFFASRQSAAAVRKETERLAPPLLAGACSGALVGLLLALLALLVGRVDMRDIFVYATPTLVELLTLGLPIGLAALVLIGGGAVLGTLGWAWDGWPALFRRMAGAGVGLILLLSLLRELVQDLLVNQGLPRAQQGFLFAGKGLSPWGVLILLGIGAGWVYLRPYIRRWLSTPLGRLIGLSLEGWAALYLAQVLLERLVLIWRPEVAPVSFIVRLALWAGSIVAWSLLLALHLPLRRQVQERFQKPRSGQVADAFLLVNVLLILPLLLGIRWSDVLDNIGLYVLMGLGLNIVVGFAGLLDLGYVAFFAIGAYTAGFLTSLRPQEFSVRGVIGWPFWAAWPVAILLAAVAGILLGIPVLRMRGDYLAIVTLGFGEIIQKLANSDLLKPYIGGAQGILDIPKPVLVDKPLIGSQELYYLIFFSVLLVIYISLRLAPSRIGRAWMAMREDEDVAEAMGIHLVSYKLMAFAVGAAFSGMAGAIFASKLSSIFPNSFSLLISINVLCLIIVGGMGSIPGVVVGALILVGLPEVLQEFAEYRLLFYGALLVFMMLARPEGFWPARRRLRWGVEEAGEKPASRTG